MVWHLDYGSATGFAAAGWGHILGYVPRYRSRRFITTFSNAKNTVGYGSFFSFRASLVRLHRTIACQAASFSANDFAAFAGLVDGRRSYRTAATSPTSGTTFRKYTCSAFAPLK